jgi:predicted lipoprotein with Yx(FWY)xxD motif
MRARRQGAPAPTEEGCMTAKRYLIVPLAGVALAAAGCGSSSSSITTKSASHKSTTMTKTESMPMTETSTSMAMSGSGHTVASMVAMGMTPEHAEVTVASSPHYGNVLYDKDHFALYVFSADHGSSSTCYGACSAAKGGWPPLLTKGAPRVAGLNAALLGTTKRKSGSLQVTYAGHPLYYWSGDTAHTIFCQHVKLHGGFWYVVNAHGTANTAKGIDTMAAMSG